MKENAESSNFLFNQDLFLFHPNAYGSGMYDIIYQSHLRLESVRHFFQNMFSIITLGGDGSNSNEAPQSWSPKFALSEKTQELMRNFLMTRGQKHAEITIKTNR